MKNDIKIIDKRLLVIPAVGGVYGVIGLWLIGLNEINLKAMGLSYLLDFSLLGYLLVILGIGILGILLPSVILARLILRHKQRKYSASVPFSAAPNWQDRYKRAIENAGTTKAELERHVDINPVASTLPSNSKYPVLEHRKETAAHYLSIHNLEKTIKKSNISQHQKERASQLKALSEKVLANLQELQDIGQLDESSSTNQHSSQLHTARADKKLETILTDMNNIIADQAMKLSNEIDSLEIPDNSTIENQTTKKPNLR